MLLIVIKSPLNYLSLSHHLKTTLQYFIHSKPLVRGNFDSNLTCPLIVCLFFWKVTRIGHFQPALQYHNFLNDKTTFIYMFLLNGDKKDVLKETWSFLIST